MVRVHCVEAKSAHELFLRCSWRDCSHDGRRVYCLYNTTGVMTFRVTTVTSHLCFRSRVKHHQWKGNGSTLYRSQKDVSRFECLHDSSKHVASVGYPSPPSMMSSSLSSSQISFVEKQNFHCSACEGSGVLVEPDCSGHRVLRPLARILRFVERRHTFRKGLPAATRETSTPLVALPGSSPSLLSRLRS